MKQFDFLRPISTKRKMRIGPNMDGGYVVYQPVLQDVEALVTYGVGWDVGFELSFNKIRGHRVVMFDHTMFGKYILNLRAVKIFLLKGEIKRLAEYLPSVWRTWRWLKQMRKQNIIFVNEGIGTKCGGKYNTLGNHLKQYHLTDKQIFLKVDIEGAEYSIFEESDTYQHLINVSQIVIEFHDLHIFFFRFKNIVCRLREDYEIIHIHGNNWGGEFSFTSQEENNIVVPKVLELTLVQKARIAACDIVNKQFSYPTKNLDYSNNPNIADLDLSFLRY